MAGEARGPPGPREDLPLGSHGSHGAEEKGSETCGRPLGWRDRRMALISPEG